jgi:hypothetical protein
VRLEGRFASGSGPSGLAALSSRIERHRVQPCRSSSTGQPWRKVPCLAASAQWAPAHLEQGAVVGSRRGAPRRWLAAYAWTSFQALLPRPRLTIFAPPALAVSIRPRALPSVRPKASAMCASEAVRLSAASNSARRPAHQLVSRSSAEGYVAGGTEAIHEARVGGSPNADCPWILLAPCDRDALALPGGAASSRRC